jgi:hypothetical protein
MRARRSCLLKTRLYGGPWALNLFEVPPEKWIKIHLEYIRPYHYQFPCDFYGASEIRVILADQTQYPTRVVGVDPDQTSS